MRPETHSEWTNELIRWCDVKAVILNFAPGIHNEAVKHDRKASRSAQAPTLHKSCSCFYEQKWSERNRSNEVPPAKRGMFVASLHLRFGKHVTRSFHSLSIKVAAMSDCEHGVIEVPLSFSDMKFQLYGGISDDIVGRELWLLKITEHTTSLKSPYKAEFVKTSFQNSTSYNTKTALVNTHLLRLYFHFCIQTKTRKNVYSDQAPI